MNRHSERQLLFILWNYPRMRLEPVCRRLRGLYFIKYFKNIYVEYPYICLTKTKILIPMKKTFLLTCICFLVFNDAQVSAKCFVSWEAHAYLNGVRQNSCSSNPSCF